MKRIEKTVHIEAPVEAVFTYLDDVSRQPEWLLSLIEITDMKGAGSECTWRWAYRMAGITFRGGAQRTTWLKDSRITNQSIGGIRSTWDFRMEPAFHGTDLKLSVQYRIPGAVFGRLPKSVLLERNEREAAMAVANIKELVEAKASIATS